LQKETNKSKVCLNYQDDIHCFSALENFESFRHCALQHEVFLLLHFAQVPKENSLGTAACQGIPWFKVQCGVLIVAKSTKWLRARRPANDEKRQD
jgi:hypothetical protein